MWVFASHWHILCLSLISKDKESCVWEQREKLELNLTTTRIAADSDDHLYKVYILVCALISALRVCLVLATLDLLVWNCVHLDLTLHTS